MSESSQEHGAESGNLLGLWSATASMLRGGLAGASGAAILVPEAEGGGVSTVGGIVEVYLKGHGYDGLFSEDNDCCCSLDDLILCMWDGAEVRNCKPGYKVSCNCGGHEYHISPTRCPGRKGGGKHAT